MNFASIWEGFKERLGDTSKWGQWIGAIVIVDIMFLWTYSCVKKGDVVAIDTNLVAVLLTIFVMNGLKRPSKPESTAVMIGAPGPAGPQGPQGFQGEPAVATIPPSV